MKKKKYTNICNLLYYYYRSDIKVSFFFSKLSMYYYHIARTILVVRQKWQLFLFYTLIILSYQAYLHKHTQNVNIVRWMFIHRSTIIKQSVTLKTRERERGWKGVKVEGRRSDTERTRQSVIFFFTFSFSSLGHFKCLYEFRLLTRPSKQVQPSFSTCFPRICRIFQIARHLSMGDRWSNDRSNNTTPKRLRCSGTRSIAEIRVSLQFGGLSGIAPEINSRKRERERKNAD